MFENLQDKLEGAFKNLKGQGKLTELNIAATVKDIRRALVDADVNYKIAKEFTDTIKDKAMGQNVLTSVAPGQLMVKIVSDELTQLMGGTATEINIKGSPAVILISGLQGSGKTTFSGKLANHIKTKLNKTPLLVACDVYRPAAVDQLKVLGEQIGVEVYSEPENKNPVSIAQNAIAYAKQKGQGVVIVDTAGRLAVDEEMMTEIYNVKQAIQPQETLFVVDSMTGQDAVNTAKAFNERINFDGVSGFIAKVKDAKSLQQKVEEFLSLEQPKRREMEFNARQRAIDLFDNKIVIQKYFSVLEKIKLKIK